MHMDACDCLWDWEGDTLNIAPCARHQDEVERAKRIAWKLVARRKMSFRQAWEHLAMKFMTRLVNRSTTT